MEDKEKELILDNIRAEIEQNAYSIVGKFYHVENGMSLYEILQIIDKYKAEIGRERTTKEEAKKMIEHILDITPNEPPIECDNVEEWLDEDYKIRKALNTAIEALDEKPRKGEWVRVSNLSEEEDTRYKCSRCGNVVNYKSKIELYTFNGWCGRCGSDNRLKIEVEA